MIDYNEVSNLTEDNFNLDVTAHTGATLEESNSNIWNTRYRAICWARRLFKRVADLEAEIAELKKPRPDPTCSDCNQSMTRHNPNTMDCPTKTS